MIDLYEEHARAKEQVSPDWHLFSWECFPKSGREPTLYVQVRGAVCKVTFQRGRRKGQMNWGRREKSTERTVILPVADHEKFCEEWEKRTGLCRNCTGEGKVFASWNHITGTKYRPCARCRETGKAPHLLTS